MCLFQPRSVYKLLVRQINYYKSSIIVDMVGGGFEILFLLGHLERDPRGPNTVKNKLQSDLFQ